MAAPAQRAWHAELQKVDREKISQKMRMTEWKQSTVEGRQSMKERYTYIMQEVDMACDSFVTQYNHPMDESGEKPRFQFMDVCCCPGGFSEYFLLAVPHSRGFGLSLPSKLGGHILAPNSMNYKTMCNEPSVLVNNKERYTIYFEDITTIASSLTAADFWSPGANALNGVDKATPADEANPSMRNNFTHMILDGSFLGAKENIYMETMYKTDLENPVFNVYAGHVEGHQAILTAQLAIMAANLQDGGHVVLRMSMTWTHFTWVGRLCRRCALSVRGGACSGNGVLALLRRIFKGKVQNYKPRSCHQDAISYYLVCQNFDLNMATQLKVGPRFAELTKRLRAGASSTGTLLVPFPELPEGRSTRDMYQLWDKALQVYYLPLWIFRDFVHFAKQNPRLPTQYAKPLPCWKKLVYKDLPQVGCKMGIACEYAHSQRELHPFTKIAFSQVNGLLYKPMFLDPRDPRFGMLRPGQGHPRNEHKEVQKLVVEWTLCAKGEPVLPGVSDPATCAASPLHQHCRLAFSVLALPEAEKIWAYLSHRCHTMYLRHFRNTTPQVGSAVNMGGLPSFHDREVVHMLLGPDAPPLPAAHSHAGHMPHMALQQPPMMQQPAAHPEHVFGGQGMEPEAWGVGLGPQGAVQGGIRLPGSTVQGSTHMEEGAGFRGGMAGLELEPEVADAVLVGGDGGDGWGVGDYGTDGDTFGTEVYQGAEDDLSAMQLSGYAMPFITVQVADEYSHDALLQYLGE